MKKGLIYSSALFAMVLLGTSETLADNPFNWGPYERDETSDRSIDASSQHQTEEEHEASHEDHHEERGE